MSTQDSCLCFDLSYTPVKYYWLNHNKMWARGVECEGATSLILAPLHGPHPSSKLAFILISTTRLWSFAAVFYTVVMLKHRQKSCRKQTHNTWNTQNTHKLDTLPADAVTAANYVSPLVKLVNAMSFLSLRKRYCVCLSLCVAVLACRLLRDYKNDTPC